MPHSLRVGVGASTCVLEFESDTTFLHIKQQLSLQEGIPVDDFFLQFDGGVIADDATVGGLGGDTITLIPFMADCTRAAAPHALTTAWSEARVAPLLAADTPLAASGLLAAALRVPVAASRGGRFPVGTPASAGVLVELLLGVVQFARDLALPPAAAAAALSAAHGVVARAAAAARSGRGWPPLAAAREGWEAALAACTAPARGASEAAHVLSHAQGAALNAWAQDSSLLLAHHWTMYGEALGGGGAGPGTREEVVVALVEEPPAPEALPPLAAARDA